MNKINIFRVTDIKVFIHAWYSPTCALHTNPQLLWSFSCLFKIFICLCVCAYDLFRIHDLNRVFNLLLLTIIPFLSKYFWVSYASAITVSFGCAFKSCIQMYICMIISCVFFVCLFVFFVFVCLFVFFIFGLFCFVFFSWFHA